MFRYIDECPKDRNKNKTACYKIGEDGKKKEER